MRKRTLLIGVVILLFGIYLIYGESGIVEALATSTATTFTKPEIQKQILRVEENSYSYLSTSISINNIHSIEFSYTATDDLNFYVMNEVEFDVWKSGRNTSFQYALLLARSLNSTLTLDRGGTYYFVFDNERSNSAKAISVIFYLTKEVTITETNPLVTYLPFGFIIIGLVLIWPGLGGKPKQPAKDRATLERIAASLNINPKGLSDKQLREKISKAT